MPLQGLIDMTTSGLGYIVGPLIGSLLYGVCLSDCIGHLLEFEEAVLSDYVMLYKIAQILQLLNIL